MANIRDVAKKAGVSITTVSRILNGDVDFKTSPQTRDAVNKAIKELNYSPTTKINKMHIGVILPVTGDKYSDPYVTTILQSLEEEAEKRNMAIVQTRNYSELTNPIVFNDFINSDIRGVVCMERLPADIYKKVKAKIPAMIFVDDDEDSDIINTVGFSHAHVAAKVMRYLLDECGYERIAIIGESDAIQAPEEQMELALYREFLRRRDIKYDSSIIKDCHGDITEAMKITDELMNLKNPPDCIWANCDQIAAAVINELTRLGYKCPKDVGVFGCNNNPIAQHTVPSISTIQIPMKEMGIIAIDRLFYLVHKRDIFPVNVHIPTELVIRESTRKVK